MHVRELEDHDRPWLREELVERWGALRVVSRGKLHYPDRQPGFVAVDGQRRLGFLTYDHDGDAFEIVALLAGIRRRGVGRALVEAAIDCARGLGASRVWLVTTNDTEPAQAFYEAVGFRRVAVHEDAIAESRQLKPEIPRYGIGDVEIEDEWEYERTLDGSPAPPT